jgi:hypothetical protein
MFLILFNIFSFLVFPFNFFFKKKIMRHMDESL